MGNPHNLALVVDLRSPQTPREQAVAKFRELADRLESGELFAARVSWRDGRDYVEYVEGDDRSVTLRRLHTGTGEVEDLQYDPDGPRGG